MAHSCDCGYTCHCGGDIDDIEFDDSPEARRCCCNDCGSEDDDQAPSPAESPDV